MVVQGGAAETFQGDYISASLALGGLNTYYSYFIEVPPGLGQLVIDLFDADIGDGGAGEAAANRDRARSVFNTSVIYQVRNPSGTPVATSFSFCSAGSCAARDNTWTNLYTTASPAAGHWEVRVNESRSVTAGDDINAFGIRAHDGDSTSGGTELPVYYHSFGGYGTNAPSLTRTYTHYPYITSGCTSSLTEFDWDSDSGSTGSTQVTSRTAAYSQTTPTLSVNDAWQANGFGPWTSDEDGDDYGIWSLGVSITGYFNGGDPLDPAGNYGVVYFRTDAAAAPPPTSQPQANTLRVYLPTDAGTAPVKPYLEQFLRYKGGVDPPAVGSTTTLTVTVRLVNPTSRSITFSASNLVTAYVPGAPVLYAGNAQVTQGTVVSQPAVGGSGNITWNPGTVTAGSTLLLSYEVNFSPASAGQRAVVTGTVSANGTTARYVDETGNTTQSRATYTLGPLCELAGTEAMETHALIAGFRAFADGGRLVLTWETTSEVGSLGFLVERLDPVTGQLSAVTERPVTGQPVTGATVPALGSPRGGRYQIVDEAVSPHAPVPTYLLTEIDHQGRRRSFGPFRPEIDFETRPDAEPGAGQLRPLPEVALRRYARRAAEHATEHAAEHATEHATERTAVGLGGSAPGREPEISQRGPWQGALAVLVREPGLYRLGAREIAAGLGSDAATVERWIGRGRLRLSNRGQQVAWLGETGGEGLLFYGEGIDSLFTRDNVYLLEARQGLGMGTAPLGNPAPAPASGSYRATVHAEEDLFAATVLPLDPRSDYWFWRGILAGHPTLGSASLPLASPALAPEGDPGELTVHLQGATSSGVAGEHRAAVSLNGFFLGETVWEGITAATAVFPVDPGFLVDGSNTVEVEGIPVPGVALGGFYVDSFDLSYPRRYEAAGGELLATGSGRGTVSVAGFPDPEILVFDLANPRRPRLGTGATVTGIPGDHQVSFRPRRAGVPYLAVSAAGVRQPLALVPKQPADLRSPRNRAEYLVIAPGEFLAAAEALAQTRRDRGLTAMVVTVEDVMDEFHDSIPDPQALRDFLAHAYASWQEPPRFVALAGDGSSDYRDLLGFGDSLVPPFMVATPFGLFAADMAYGDVVGDDGVPEIAVGRIPALTAGELQDYVNRLVDYEAAGAGGANPVPDGIVLMADNPDRGADFARQSERLRSLLGHRYGTRGLYLGTAAQGGLSRDEVRDGLFADLAAGTAGLLHYTGHGSAAGLAAEGLITLADLPALTGEGTSPFVLTALTCALNRFELPGFVTLSEGLVVSSEGGALAVWAPSGLSYYGEAAELAEGFFAVLRESPGPVVLGEAVTASLLRYGGAGGEAPAAFREMLDVYNVLGDPALLLRLAPTPPLPPTGGGPPGE